VSPEGDVRASVTPDDVVSAARAKAAELLQMDETTRRSEMAKLKSHDQSLWANVKGQMQQLRQEAASAGREQALPQVLAEVE
jgi:precorrin-4 methylase